MEVAMKSKFISAALVLALALTAVLPLAGCGDEDYPVEVANIVIEKQPERVVILDAPTADIISYMGFLNIEGKSDEVDQEWLGVVPSMGSALNPDAEKIKAANADVVFAGEELDENARKNLEESGIKVITMSHAATVKELETAYNTLGKILYGRVTGEKEGKSSFEELLDEMEAIENAANSAKATDVPDTVCYLYADGGSLKMMTSGTYGDMLLGYTGAVNAAVNIEENIVNVDTLKIANPKYIFYADDETLAKIKADATLSKLTAVKTGKMLMITENEMNRQGQTAIDTLKKMVYFMYPSLAQGGASADQTPTNAAVASQQSATSSTAPSSAQSDESSSVAARYKINITDKLTLKPEDENKNVKAMQQRLYDLGYVTDRENITGYYGEISEDAVKEFQKNNSLDETGVADNKTLVVMFDSSAEKAQ